MRLDPISELRQKYLTDEDGNVSKRSSFFDYEDWMNSIEGTEQERIQKIKTRFKRATYNNVSRKHMVESYSKSSGDIIDPIWSQYTYEEIIQMEDTGVDIPKEVKNWAHSMQNSDSTNYELETDESTESSDTNQSNETNEENPFLDLVGKAKTNVKSCEEKDKQINEALEKLNPLADESKTLKEKIKDSKKTALEKIESIVTEWKTLKAKYDKGETLTSSEQKRFDELSKSFQKQESDNRSNTRQNSAEFNKMTREIQQLSETAQITNTLGGETYEIGEQLSDYESKSKFKTTKKTLSQTVGFLGAIAIMAVGKDLANQATKTGTETQEFTNDVQANLNEMASIMDIQASLQNGNEQPQDEETQKTQAEQKGSEVQTEGNYNIKNEAQNSVNKKQSEDKQTNENTAEKVINQISESGSKPAEAVGIGTKPSVPVTVASADSVTPKTSTKTNPKTKEEEQPIDSKNGKQAAKDLKNQEGGARNAARNAQEKTKASNKIQKNAKNTDKELKNEDKALKKRIKNEETLLKKNQEKIELIGEKIEQDALAIEALNIEIAAYVANEENNKQSAPKPAPQLKAKQKGAVSGTGGTTNTTSSTGAQSNNSIAGKVTELQSQVVTKSTSITKNTTQMYKLQNVSKKTTRSMQKLNTKYVKSVQKTTKKLNEDTQEESKILKIAEKVEGICSPIAFTGMAVKIAGQLLMKVVLPPWIPIVGAFMVPIGASAEALGNYGVAAANVTKMAVYAAQGNLLGALMSAGMAAISGVSAVGATKTAVQGFKALGDTVKGIGLRAAGAELAKEGAKEMAEQGVTKAGIESLKEGAEDLTNGLVDEALKTGSTEALESTGKEIASGVLNSGASTLQNAGTKVVAGTFIKQTANRAIQELGKVTMKEMGMGLLQSGMSFAQSTFGQEKPQAEEAKLASAAPAKVSKRFRNIQKRNNNQRVSMASTTDRHSNGNKKKR